MLEVYDGTLRPTFASLSGTVRATKRLRPATAKYRDVYLDNRAKAPSRAPRSKGCVRGFYAEIVVPAGEAALQGRLDIVAIDTNLPGWDTPEE